MKIYSGQGIAAFLLSLALSAPAATHYVDVNGTNATPPFLDWSTAATNIQDAVDAAVADDEIVVTNGAYATGGRVVNGALTNRIALTKPVKVRSLNGPAVTMIEGNPTIGDSAVRCAYLTNGASLTGFTLRLGATRMVSNGTADGIGGGIWCESTSAFVTNCVLAENSCGYGGGGIYQGTLVGCLIKSNTATQGRGFGAAWNSKLYNSALIGNVTFTFQATAFNCQLLNCLICANSSGGASGGTLVNCTVANNAGVGIQNLCVLTNCIVYDNGSVNGSGTFIRCCVNKLPASGSDNFTNAPVFVDATALNFRLQSNSPCINAGHNASAPGGPDLDGNPRIVSGTVDLGAYEFQGSGSQISYAWLQQHGLPTDGSVDYLDPDADGMNNWREWRCGTDPTNTLSVLRLLTLTGSSSGATVSWQSVTNLSYSIERTAGLTPPLAFASVASNLPGQLGTATFTDTNAVGSGPFFYRVGVQP